MSFTLQTEAGPEGLAPLGAVELRELPYGAMRDAMAAGDKPGQSADRLLAASMHVDGEAIGYEGLQALPGRFAGALTEALTTCMRMHGLADTAAADDAPKG